MPHNPLIAIVGSVNPARAEELDLQELDTAVQAAEDLGRELARAGCRILVYSSHPEYVEHHVVRGYLDSGEGKPRSIQVRYPLSDPQPDFPDQAANKRLFDWRPSLSRELLFWALFFCPVLGGVSGATIRLVFDFREGTLPLTTQSALTTAALGLVAGGIAGLLFITAQMTGIPSGLDGEVQKTVVEALQRDQAKNLVPFALAIGFLAGLTLDAVFRRLIRSSVLRTEGVEVAGND
ncbi:MAG: hypothetical protein PVG07_11420 [Acidobacteriota bacterium]|jgi:hypothetical protein